MGKDGTYRFRSKPCSFLVVSGIRLFTHTCRNSVADELMITTFKTLHFNSGRGVCNDEVMFQRPIGFREKAGKCTLVLSVAMSHHSSISPRELPCRKAFGSKQILSYG